jgi:hypothetical protein
MISRCNEGCLSNTSVQSMNFLTSHQEMTLEEINKLIFFDPRIAFLEI